MNARVFFLLALIACLPVAAAWSQEAPPGPYYAPPPGAAAVAPAQPYVYAYPQPVVVAPPAIVLTPAPPLPSYDWSVAVDALFLDRSSGGRVPLGYTLYTPPSHHPAEVRIDRLDSDDVLFPLEAGLRFEVSRQFDTDLTLAATYWGLQQWSAGDTIYGDPLGERVLAYSPYLQLPTLLHGLDDSLGYTSVSRIENAEFNALFRLGPQDPYRRLYWLWGARYVYFTDRFSLLGIDDLHNAAEQLDWSTTNNLVGAQTGLLFVHGWDRLQWEAGLKLGLMANIYRQRGRDFARGLSGVPAGFTPFDVSHSGADLAGLVEFSLAARFRLSNCLWARVGYQLDDLIGLAVASRQLRGFSHGGNVAFDGLSIGLQATW